MVTLSAANTILPPPPQIISEDVEIYERFMRHLRNVPTSRIEIKILSAIQFTADFVGHSDAHVAKALVEFGLRAPRMAFPAEFLKYADMALMRTGWEVGGPSAALKELKLFWDTKGEDKLAVFRGEYDYAVQRVFF
jgi:hypothetical protein